MSSTLEKVDWNAELLRGNLEKAVQQLKREPGKGLFVGGVKLPQALAELGLIDEYELVVHPRLAGHGPTWFAGLSKPLDLTIVSRLEFASGVVAMRYEPKRSGSRRDSCQLSAPERGSVSLSIPMNNLPRSVPLLIGGEGNVDLWTTVPEGLEQAALETALAESALRRAAIPFSLRNDAT